VSLPRALLLDMDGVLYRGSSPIEGAAEFLHAISERPFRFITNNPIATPEQVVSKMKAMGLGNFATDHVITSAQATARYLASEKADFRFYAIGEKGLHTALSTVGVEDDQDADYVVVGEGAGLDYQTLSKAIALIQQGAVLISTNPDITVDGFVDGKPVVLPGGGALVAPVEKACGIKAITIGKPEPLLYQMALADLDVEACDCVMVGDRPDTDILGAQRLGLKTALVRTGRFSIDAQWPVEQAPPNWDTVNLQQLLAAWI
jgi:NagD protein